MHHQQAQLAEAPTTFEKVNRIDMFKFVTSLFGMAKDDLPNLKDEQPKRLSKPMPKSKKQIISSQIVENGTSLETWVLAHQDFKLFFATTDGRLSREDIDHADPSTWPPSPTPVTLTEVKFEDVYPKAKADYIEFEYPEGENQPDVYYKMLLVVQFRWPQNLAYTRTREIQICEYLRQYAHPNFVEYRGVYTDDKLNYQAQGKLVKIPLDKELVTMLVFGYAIDVAQCLRSISTGLACLHI
jgi:hypothetical protein